MTMVKTNEIIKFKVASETPNIEKSISLGCNIIDEPRYVHIVLSASGVT